MYTSFISKNILFFASCFLIGTISQASEFVVLGDTGKNNESQRAVSNALTEYCKTKSCQFAVMTGDNVYEGTIPVETDRAMKEVFENYYSQLPFPFYMTLGNHDYGSTNYIWSKGREQIQYAKHNPQFVLPNNYYYVEKQNEVIAIIDTTRILFGHDIAEQAAMLDQAYALAKQKNKWFLVVGHHPYISNDEYGNAGEYKDLPNWIFKSLDSFSGLKIKKFTEQYICGRADAYFCGHDHSLQVLDGNIKNCNTLMVVSGAGASASHLMKARNPILYQGSTLGFVSVNTSPTTIEFQVVDEKLNSLYSTSLHRQ